MTLIEAIKSGKKFHRQHWETWYSSKSGVVQTDSGQLLGALTEDLVANDWEIEEFKIEITEASWNDAIRRTNEKWNSTNYAAEYFISWMDLFREELGFK